VTTPALDAELTAVLRTETEMVLTAEAAVAEAVVLLVSLHDVVPVVLVVVAVVIADDVAQVPNPRADYAPSPCVSDARAPQSADAETPAMQTRNERDTIFSTVNRQHCGHPERPVLLIVNTDEAPCFWCWAPF